MLLILTVLIPVVLVIILILIFSTHPVKRKDNIITIGYPLLCKSYDSNEYIFALNLAQLFRFGQITSPTGGFFVNEKPYYTMLGTNKIVIYVYEKKNENSKRLVATHIIDVGITKRKAVKEFMQICHLFPDNSKKRMASYY